MESWKISPNCELYFGKIITLWPLIETNHTKFPKDVQYIDMDRAHLLYNKKGKILPGRLNPRLKFWTKERPLPFNSISNDEEIRQIWRLEKGLERVIFLKSRAKIDELISTKNADPEHIILIMVLRTNTEKKVKTMNVIKITISKDEYTLS